jgi:hypothetical protein
VSIAKPLSDKWPREYSRLQSVFVCHLLFHGIVVQDKWDCCAENHRRGSNGSKPGDSQTPEYGIIFFLTDTYNSQTGVVTLLESRGIQADYEQSFIIHLSSIQLEILYGATHTIDKWRSGSQSSVMSSSHVNAIAHAAYLGRARPHGAPFLSTDLTVFMLTSDSGPKS